MPTRRGLRAPSVLRSLLALALAALSAALAVVMARDESAGAPASRGAAAVAAVAWQGLVGEPRPPVAVGRLAIVVLKAPSLADRVAAAGGRATGNEERAWTRSARNGQRLFISRLRVQGAEIRPLASYARVLNGFAAPLDPRAVALLERSPEVEGIYPVRVGYPAAASRRVFRRAPFAPGSGLAKGAGLPGFDGRGVIVALLDTGVDRGQPYLSGRVEDGIDIVDGGERALAAPRPDNPAELERHGTQLAGILVGANGPAGIAGVATGATVLPIRVAGWQQDATGRWAVYSRTDQIVAGLERAVDPNDDGDAHDAARIALVGVAERYAAFADGPLARAAGGATRLDTLVIVPAGNEGPAGPGFGSISGPGGAPTALTVGAADVRRHTERVRVALRVGLRAVLDRLAPLAGAVAPDRPLTLAVGAPRAARGEAPALADFFDERGFSRVAGRAALVPAGAEPAAGVRAAARAGAAAAVLYGAPVPAGALGLDERAAIPVVSVPAAAGRALLRALVAGDSVGVSIGTGAMASAPGGRRVAPFSSRGLAFDGRVKPELMAPGVGIATSEPGANEDGSPRYGTVNGSSAAAAVVAGIAAVLAQARPELGAGALKSVLAGSAKPVRGGDVTAQGAGLVDAGAAAAAELATQPASLAFGRAAKPGWKSRRRVVVRNLSARTLRLRVRVERRGFPAADTFVAASRRRLILRPGATARVRVVARVPRPAPGGPPAEGALVLAPSAGVPLRIPFAVAFAPRRTRLLAEIELSAGRFKPSDTSPAVLSLLVGGVCAEGAGNACADSRQEVQPVERLDIELYTGDGKRIGVIARQRNLLPGRYAFGITGRDPGGQRLESGLYRLRVVALPSGGGLATVRSLTIRVD